MDYAINVNNLSKTFKVNKKQAGIKASLKSLFKPEYTQIEAVKNVNFKIEQGELVGFIGPNGAGKTTTLKMLSGLLYPSSGQVSVLGYTPFKRDNNFLKQISLVMGQKNQLYWDLPAIETFNLVKEIYEVDSKKYKNIIDELIEMLDVKSVINQPVRKLSLGQRMKCELIASLIHTPKVLFLDEPTIGLDVVVQKKLRQFIKEYNQKYNSTIILTSHYMGDVRELCNRVIIINNGSVGYDGNFSNLIKKYAKTKTITLIFTKEVLKNDLKPYGKIVDFEPLKATIEIKRDLVPHTAALMLKNLPVDDLDISEIAIEEVVRQIFEEKQS